MTGRRHLLAAALTMGSALSWAAGPTLSRRPWEPGSAAVIGVGLVVAATLAVVLVVLQSSPLGYRLSWGLLGFEAILAGLLPITGWWWVGAALVMMTGACLADPTLGGWIRQQPLPTPVPASALALCLTLLAIGPVTALVSPGTELNRLPMLTAGAWLVLLWYIRRWPGRELVPRLANPLLAVAGMLLPSPARWVWLAAMVAASALAWTTGARLAVRPLVERGHPVPIPPELAPADVLHTAGIDEKGQRRGEPR